MDRKHPAMMETLNFCWYPIDRNKKTGPIFVGKVSLYGSHLLNEHKGKEKANTCTNSAVLLYT